jgi:hypothetical protein
MSGQNVISLGFGSGLAGGTFLTVGWIVSAIVTLVFVAVVLSQLARPLGSELP